MKFEETINFPCGYVITFRVRGLGLAVKADFDDQDLPICPIHGKSVND